MSREEIDGAMRLEFDTEFFGIEALQKAALKFTHNFSFDFEASAHSVVVNVTKLPSAGSRDLKELALLYRNEVLDQHLRQVIAKETETERNLILAYAFSNTKLIES